MSTILYYYAQLNENDICYGFESKTKKYTKEEQPSNLVYLPDYNESYIWSKYDRETGSFSQEKYEPSVDTQLQETVATLQEENAALKQANFNLNNKINELDGTILELTTIIANLQGGN